MNIKNTKLEPNKESIFRGYKNTIVIAPINNPGYIYV